MVYGNAAFKARNFGDNPKASRNPYLYWTNFTYYITSLLQRSYLLDVFYHIHRFILARKKPLSHDRDRG
jgi:hypothetical protein